MCTSATVAKTSAIASHPYMFQYGACAYKSRTPAHNFPLLLILHYISTTPVFHVSLLVLAAAVTAEERTHCNTLPDSKQLSAARQGLLNPTRRPNRNKHQFLFEHSLVPVSDFVVNLPHDIPNTKK